jgi:PAS domain S-box-containing protein
VSPPPRPASLRLRDLSIGAKLGGMVAMFIASAAGALAIVALAFTVSSGVRAFVGAESQWSKGQKDAVYALTRYLDTGDRRARLAFDAAIAFPLGDRQARLELSKPAYDDLVVYRGFLAGGVAAADIPEMIFLFRNFRSVGFVSHAIGIWAQADDAMQDLLQVAGRIDEAERAGRLDRPARQAFLDEVDAINTRVTPLEQAFSTVLGDGARRLQWLLLGIILVATGTLLTLALSVAWLVSRDLKLSIAGLRDGANRVARGELEARIPVRSRDELGVLARELNEMVDRRREAEVALKAANDFREKVMDNVTNAIYTIDREGRFMTANRRTCEITGYTLGELLGMRWASLVTDREQLDALLPRYRDVLEGGPAITDHEVPITRRDGSTVILRFSTSALRRDDEIFAIVVAAEDVTARKRDEAELKARAEELARSNKELEQFAYVASHDLQEPLRTVSGFAQLLQRRYEGKLGADADEYIGYVTAGVQRMKSLIEDLLAYSRVTRSTEPLQPVPLERVVATALANLQGAIEAAGATVSVGPLPTLPANERQLVQLFQNLVGNAVKFRAEAPPRVDIDAVLDGKEWRLTVRDNGIGIDPKHADQVFVLFQRLNGRDKYPGNGIGLTICKKIVDLHHGRISVEPGEPGHPGTVFRIVLPAA